MGVELGCTRLHPGAPITSTHQIHCNERAVPISPNNQNSLRVRERLPPIAVSNSGSISVQHWVAVFSRWSSCARSCAISCQQHLWLWPLAFARHQQQPARRASCTWRLQGRHRQQLGTRQGAKAYWDHCSVLQSPRQQPQQHKSRTQLQGHPKLELRAATPCRVNGPFLLLLGKSQSSGPLRPM